MEKGVKFVQDNFNKILELTKKPEYSYLKSKVVFEMNSFKKLTKTSDVYEFFLKYAKGDHKNAPVFKFLEDYGLLSSEKICDYLLENFPDEIGNALDVDKLIVNNVYNDNELTLLFGDFMKGIKVSKKKKIIACVFSHDNMYEDKWLDEQTLLYTGEGRIGDQRVTSAGNKEMITALNNSNEWRVFLFEKITKSKYYYRGEVSIDPTIKNTPNVLDENHKPRTVIQFTLRLKNYGKKFTYTEEDVEIIEESRKKTIEKLTPEIIHHLARHKEEDSKCRYTSVKQYNRDQTVAKDTKNRAKGICDLCDKEAPFKTKNGPYLESHHLIWISRNGPDNIYNTVALCPNCHRRVHELEDKKDFNKLKNKIEEYLKKDNDTENLIYFNNLFN